MLLARGDDPILWGRLGPTHDNFPPFCWHDVKDIRNHRGFQLSHAGHPDCFGFEWSQFPPVHIL